MEFYNSAIIQEEILTNISLVVEHNYPAGPSFLHSLGALTEAVVLHENVYFDPVREAQKKESKKPNIYSIIDSSPFVQRLMRDGALVSFPSSDNVNTHLKSKGSDYDYWEFITDSLWGLASFASSNPDGQRQQYLRQATLMDSCPKIFHSKTLVDDFDEGEDPKLLDKSAILLMNAGVTLEAILYIENLNRKGCGYVDLARNLELNLYLLDVALPHQLGAIRIGNQKAREIYEVVVSRLNGLDDENIGETNYQNIPIPPLCQILLSNCKDSPQALAEELLNLRYHNRKFRRYLTDYETNWKTAKTRKDRIRLKDQFTNAWQTLTTAESKPSTRLIYTLWDILKNPLKIHEKIGDKLADKGKEISVIEQVRGLHDFWNQLLYSPVPDQNRGLLQQLFPNHVEQEVWDAAKRFRSSAKNFLGRSDDSSTIL